MRTSTVQPRSRHPSMRRRSKTSVFTPEPVTSRVANACLDLLSSLCTQQLRDPGYRALEVSVDAGRCYAWDVGRTLSCFTLHGDPVDNANMLQTKTMPISIRVSESFRTELDGRGFKFSEEVQTIYEATCWLDETALISAFLCRASPLHSNSVLALCEYHDND